MSPAQSPLSRILVFDSGLGGLSIVKELSRAKLGVQVLYLADTAYFPYGEKRDDFLLARLPSLIEHAVDTTNADLVIIACNTASTLALDALRYAVRVPVIGVVPAIKPAANLTQTGTIGLLATPNTVRRAYTDQLIEAFAKGVCVVRHGAIGLAGAAEDFLCGGALSDKVVKEAMDGLFNQKHGSDIDVVVLACTHYPHLQNALQSAAPRPIIWVDSGAAIAARARTLLSLNSQNAVNLAMAFTTGGSAALTQSGLRHWGFQRLDTIALPTTSLIS